MGKMCNKAYKKQEHFNIKRKTEHFMVSNQVLGGALTQNPVIQLM